MKNLTTFRVLAESAFYTNNIKILSTIGEAYEAARHSGNTIVLDQEVFEPAKLGFPKGARVLVCNDGTVVGRSAAARRILGDENVDPGFYAPLIREAIYGLSKKESLYHSECYIGLHRDFMVKANLLIPKGYENIILSWLCNFQEINRESKAMYDSSKQMNENNLFIVSDPDWTHPDYPYGLAFFSPNENVAIILGMRYFGEFKKGTLTLAWGTADRNSYLSCHGGMKSYDKQNYVAAFFGLSGSGKSTLTHAKHENKYEITILHDDAVIIHTETMESIALEPAYFDKTADYKIGSSDNKYILTAQNVGVCMDEHGKRILISEDIRNENGRAVKSRLWSPRRVDKMDKKINAVFWLMKDPTLPPITEINDPVLASTLGAMLTTKRTSAERLAKGTEMNALVIESYANPFRTYPLINDFNKFIELFNKGVKCYILNTGDFMGQKVKPHMTLGLIEHLVDKKDAGFKSLFGSKSLRYATHPELKEPEISSWKEQFKTQRTKPNFL